MIPLVRRDPPERRADPVCSIFWDVPSSGVTARGLGRVPAPTWQWPGRTAERIRLSREWRMVFRAATIP
jgi:hypothetical protein